MTRQTAKPPLSSNPDDQAGRDVLEERIERLEKRLEETIAETDGPHVVVRTKLDDAPADPLRRAVERASDKRESKD